MTLAFQSYNGLVLDDSDAFLNLAWTLDEAEWLQPGLSEAMAPVLAETKVHLNSYPVTDPFGEGKIKPVVAARFGLRSDRFRLFCGAGVGGLIFSLAAALREQAPHILSECYPDFPEWLARFSAAWEPPEASSPTAIFLERPSFRANSKFDTLPALNRLCKNVSCPVIVDESNMNYMVEEDSAVNLVPNNRNLIVLRGLSKAYCLGGMRFGYVVCGLDAGDWVQKRLPPLQVNSVALALASAILSDSSDMLAPLRKHIVETRECVLGLIISLGLPTPTKTHHALPYIVFDPDRDPAHQRAVETLSQLGIRGKRHRLWAEEPLSFQRYSIPLNAARFARFEHLLSQLGAPPRMTDVHS